ncbi:MAG: DNA-3-methyladenine glycosylase [Actinomycetota bacterium]|nr:DNA-3-methyladenine glycosylase [Actinomycetota bacterium]
MENRLQTEFFSRDSALVAQQLLGCILVTKKEGKCSAIITETEAYYGSDDPASHAYRGLTPRNQLMFGRAAIAYVYLCYGMHNLFNIVTRGKGEPGAVLIRGAVPLEGQPLMEKRRGRGNGRLILNGPGKLTLALGIRLEDNGWDLTKQSSTIYVVKPASAMDLPVCKSARIGVRAGSNFLFRFYLPEKEVRAKLPLK